MQRSAADAQDTFDPRIESRYAWLRLFAALGLGTVGGVGMWSVVVALPFVQADFAISRADAALAVAFGMLGFGTGGIVMGSVVDRFGILRPLVSGVFCLALGYLACAHATNIWQFALAQGLLVGLLGGAISFGPLMADTSMWFSRRRGLAVAICASGNYLAGTIWPPIVQHLITSYGWRLTHIIIAAVIVLIMLPLLLLLRPASPIPSSSTPTPSATAPAMSISPRTLQWLLAFAGVSCCIAMSMPQVHIVAYCQDLGYGPARGAEMLSLMLGFGIVSRLLSGVIADRIGGLSTLLISAALQAFALALYIPFDGLMPLYIISAFFGLVQGGIIPSYAIIVREYFPANEAATRLGVVLTSTMIGMAVGGWMTGLIFDISGSYRVAFINGIIWNLFTIIVAVGLIWRTRQSRGNLAASAA